MNGRNAARVRHPQKAKTHKTPERHKHTPNKRSVEHQTSLKSYGNKRVVCVYCSYLGL